MERYFFIIIAFTFIFIIILSIKPIMSWIKLLIRYGPSFFAGKRYFQHPLHLSDEILYAGLECTRQTVESLMKISLSYKVLKAVDGFIVIWNNRWTHAIVMSEQQGRWYVRYIPDGLERVCGVMDVGLSILYNLPEVGVSGALQTFGLIDVTGLTYLMQKCIYNAYNHHLHTVDRR